MVTHEAPHGALAIAKAQLVARAVISEAKHP